MIHNIEKPVMNYHCRESDNAWHSDWVLNPKNKKCYLIGRSSVIDGSGLWLNATAARAYCTDDMNSEVMSIHSAEENDFIVPRMVGDAWLGLKMPGNGNPPTSWWDGTPFDYNRWQNGKFGSKEYARVSNAAESKYGTWTDVPLTNTYLPVCMAQAIRGPSNPNPPDVTVPPHTNCDPGWHFIEDPYEVGNGVETGGCFLLETNPRAWDAASANCQELGGQLTSINSPARQAQIFEMIGFDPTASAGKNSNQAISLWSISYGTCLGIT